MLFCESDNGEGLCAGRAPVAPVLVEARMGELVEDAFDDDRDRLVSAFREALCEILLPSAVLSPSGTITSSWDESNPENERDRGRGFFNSAGKKFALGCSFAGSANGSTGVGSVCALCLCAGILFGGSSVNDTGTGPTELARSWSNFA